jgi:hypothetical protein
MELNLHKAQSETVKHLFGKGSDEEARAAVLTMSRGAGKSLLASIVAAKGVEKLLEMPPEVLNKRVFIVGPTWGQTHSIYMPYLVGLLGLDYYANKYQAHTGKFWFGESNDVTLELASAESIARLRGLGAYLVITDEMTSWEVDVKEAFEGVLNPMQTTRWPNTWKQLNISTPMGHDYFYELSLNEEKDPRWKTIRAPYQEIPHIDQDEIQRAKATMDPIVFSREYECSFEGSSNKVFYMFSRKDHIDREVKDFVYIEATKDKPEEKEVVYCGIDFNINIQACIFFAIRGKEVHVINELKGAPNTEELARYITGLYPKRKIIAYPDPSGKAGKTSAAVGSSDFSILEKAGITVISKNAAPAIIDSVAAVNSMLKNANGEVHIKIHPKCENLIRDLERASWLDKPEKAILDKRGDNDPHFADALRYPIDYLFPVRQQRAKVSRGFGF